MIFQLIITILAIVALVSGLIWLLVGRWFVARWKAETSLEQEAQRRAEIDEASRMAAEQELNELKVVFQPTQEPSAEKQENVIQ